MSFQQYFSLETSQSSWSIPVRTMRCSGQFLAGAYNFWRGPSGLLCHGDRRSMVSWIPYPTDSSSDKRPLLLEHQFSGIRYGFSGIRYGISGLAANSQSPRRSLLECGACGPAHLRLDSRRHVLRLGLWSQLADPSAASIRQNVGFPRQPSLCGTWNRRFDKPISIGGFLTRAVALSRRGGETLKRQHHH